MRRITPALWALVLLPCVASGVQAQVFETGDLVDHIDDIIAAMPTANGGGDYLQPNVASRALWREIIDHILAGELADVLIYCLALANAAEIDVSQAVLAKLAANEQRFPPGNLPSRHRLPKRAGVAD